MLLISASASSAQPLSERHSPEWRTKEGGAARVEPSLLRREAAQAADPQWGAEPRRRHQSKAARDSPGQRVEQISPDIVAKRAAQANPDEASPRRSPVQGSHAPESADGGPARSKRVDCVQQAKISVQPKLTRFCEDIVSAVTRKDEKPTADRSWMTLFDYLRESK